MTPRYWWQDWEDDAGDTILAPAASPPPAAPRPRSLLQADPARLTLYREQLTRKALLLPRGGARRRAVEKQVAKITADLLRIELKERGGLPRSAPNPPYDSAGGRR